MKSPEEALDQVADRLRRTWAQVLAGESWAHEFRLGTSGLTGRRLAEAWPDVHRSALRWQEWVGAAGDGITLVTRPATVHGTQQPLPATLFIATIDDAARLAGSDWVARLARARQRLATLQEQFPRLDDPASLLRATDAYGDVDFELACRAGAWFAAHPAHGLTARQVPVEGMGTKWLASHGAAVRRLAGLDVRSLFMVMAAYQRWQRYGVDHDHAGNPIACRTPRDLPELRPGERELYLALCSEEWTGHRRIEQERIPLHEAAAVVRAATA